MRDWSLGLGRAIGNGDDGRTHGNRRRDLRTYHGDPLAGLSEVEVSAT
jgi:hypothetical protein